MVDILVWVLSAVLSLFGPDPCWNEPAQIDVQTVSMDNGWTVDITTVGCGSLYSSLDGVHGWHMTTYSEPPNTRTLRLPGNAAIDKNYAPVEGRVYCFVTAHSKACSPPLKKKYEVILPIIAR